VVASSRAAVTAIDLSTGKQVWRRTFVGLPYYLQMVGGVAVLTRGTPLAGSKVDTALVGIDPASGKQLWTYTGFSIPEPTAPATVGASLYVTVVHHLKAFGRRIDAHTGKAVASRRVHSIDAPVAGDDVVIWDDHLGEVAAYSSDLRRQLWKANAPAPTAVDRVVGDLLVRVADGSGTSAVFYGYDLRSGASLWTSRLTFDDRQRQFWPTSRELVTTTATSAVGLDVSDGSVRWHVQQSGIDHLAPSATADDNLLGCGKSVASIDARTGGWYGGTPLATGGFPDGCTAAPTATATLTIVASGQAVTAYRTSTADDPAPRPGDGYGDWGPVDPAVCGLNSARSQAAFAAVLGGTWRLYSAGRDGNCAYTNRSLYVITRSLTAAAARHYLQPANSDGGCTKAGADTGAEHQVSSPGLPAGSGACYVSGLTFDGTKVNDAVSGLTRQRNGKWVAVEYSVAPNTAARSGQPGKIVALLRRFARA
jgi:hypothetical protein